MGSIYCLYFEGDDNKFYIGQSINTPTRYTKHKRLLYLGKHHNKYLQNAYNHYTTYPSIYILETELYGVDLDDREMHWIREFDSYYSGYNATLGGRLFEFGDTDGGKKYPSWIYVNILFDIAYSDATSKEIAEENGVPAPIVSSIRQGVAHTYLEQEYPIEYSILVEKRGKRIKHTDETCISILRLIHEGKTYQEVVDELEVPYTLVTSLVYGNSRKNLIELDPELYKTVVLDRVAISTSNRIKAYPDLLAPDGTIHKVFTASHISEKYGLDPSSLSKVLNGKKKQYKGWTLALKA